MVDNIKMGAFLKELRKEKELTQEQLAEKFAVSSRTVSRWENGKTMPEMSVLVELADYYGVDAKEIIDGERKSEFVAREDIDTLQKTTDYAEDEKEITIKSKRLSAFAKTVIVLLILLTLLVSPRAIHLIYEYNHPQIIITHIAHSTTTSLPNLNRQIATVSVRTYGNLPLPPKIKQIVRETEAVFAQANADVISDAYIEPTVIKVSGETKEGKTYIYYTGTVATKDGETRDYYNKVVLDYPFECEWYIPSNSEN